MCATEILPYWGKYAQVTYLLAVEWMPEKFKSIIYTIIINYKDVNVTLKICIEKLIGYFRIILNSLKILK
jgi:hypothetical protein